MKKTTLALSLLFFALQIMPANAYTNRDISEALAYSGCTYGLVLDPNQFGVSQNVDSILNLGLMYFLDGQGDGKDSWNLNTKGQVGYDHVLESWATAGALNSTWRSLEPTLNKGLVTGAKKWSSGSTLGISKNAAKSVSGSKLTALCRIAQINVESKSKKSKLTVRQYVIRVTGQYLPQLP